MDLLAKESVLLRDRQQLTRHVEFLQHQLVTSTFDVSGDKHCDTDRQCDKLRSQQFITDDCVLQPTGVHQKHQLEQ